MHSSIAHLGWIIDFRFLIIYLSGQNDHVFLIFCMIYSSSPYHIAGWDP